MSAALPCLGIVSKVSPATLAADPALRTVTGFSSGPVRVAVPPTTYIKIVRHHKMEVNLMYCILGTLGIYLLPSSLPFVTSLFWRTSRWHRNVWKFLMKRRLGS